LPIRPKLVLHACLEQRLTEYSRIHNTTLDRFDVNWRYTSKSMTGLGEDQPNHLPAVHEHSWDLGNMQTFRFGCCTLLFKGTNTRRWPEYNTCPEGRITNIGALGRWAATPKCRRAY